MRSGGIRLRTFLQAGHQGGPAIAVPGRGQGRRAVVMPDHGLQGFLGVPAVLHGQVHGVEQAPVLAIDVHHVLWGCAQLQGSCLQPPALHRPGQVAFHPVRAQAGQGGDDVVDAALDVGDTGAQAGGEALHGPRFGLEAVLAGAEVQHQLEEVAIGLLGQGGPDPLRLHRPFGLGLAAPLQAAAALEVGGLGLGHLGHVGGDGEAFLGQVGAHLGPQGQDVVIAELDAVVAGPAFPPGRGGPAADRGQAASVEALGPGRPAGEPGRVGEVPPEDIGLAVVGAGPGDVEIAHGGFLLDVGQPHPGPSRRANRWRSLVVMNPPVSGASIEPSTAGAVKRPAPANCPSGCGEDRGGPRPDRHEGADEGKISPDEASPRLGCSPHGSGPGR